MNGYINSLPPYCAGSEQPVRDMAERHTQYHSGKERVRSMVNPVTAADSADKPEGKRRRVSLSDDMPRLTLAESNAAHHEPGSAPINTTVVVQPGRPGSYLFDSRALKTALCNLTNNDLSRADFIVLSNRYGYQGPLRRFPVETLQPYDWLALKEQARRQILRCHPSSLAQLPPQAITCDICMTVYMQLKSAMLSLVPDPLKNSFFTKLIEVYPLGLLDIPTEERTSEHLLAACCACSAILDRLSDGERTVELVTEACQRTGYGLQYIPEQQRSYELCLNACKKHEMALEHVPNQFKTKELYRVALTKSGRAYRRLPEQLAKSAEWQQLACQQDGEALQWIPKEQHTTDLLEAACRSCWAALKFIDKDTITYEMCRLAHANRPLLAYTYIPDQHMDDTMRWQVCSTTHDRQLCQRFKPNIAGFYERLLRENPEAGLEWVPEEERTASLCLLACQKRGYDLELVPERYRTPQTKHTLSLIHI